MSKQEAQMMLTTGSTRLAVSRGQQTWYHSTCDVSYLCANYSFLLCNSNFVFKGRVERIFFFASFKLPLFNEYEMVFIIA